MSKMRKLKLGTRLPHVTFFLPVDQVSFQPNMSNLFNRMFMTDIYSFAKGLFCFKIFLGGNHFKYFPFLNRYVFYLIFHWKKSWQVGRVGKSAVGRVDKLAEPQRLRNS